MRRTTKHFGEGYYAAPGGRIDGREPLRQAVVREAKEETGITLDPNDLEFCTVLHVASHLANKREVILFVFKVTKFQGEIQNCEPDKCDHLAFFPLDQLPENLLPAGFVALDNMRNGIPFSELYWDEEVEPID